MSEFFHASSIYLYLYSNWKSGKFEVISCKGIIKDEPDCQGAIYVLFQNNKKNERKENA